MANFETGVKDYIKAHATVTVHFPVDFKDRPEIACKHCQFFSSSTRRCHLTGMPVAFPDHYVGTECPLKEVEVANRV